MAPISLKDPNIEAITEKFVRVMTGFKKSSRNFTLSVQFALSNFRYHQFLDVNSLKVERNIDGVCQKLKVHSQSEKAEILRNLCNRFLDLPLTSNSQDVKTDAHYSLLLLLLTLSDSPTNVDYTPPPQEDEPEEEWFDWKSYLLDGEEEEILGIPSEQYQEWSEDEDDELEITSDSGISVGEQRPTHPQAQLQGGIEHSIRERELTISKPSSKEGSWIADHIIDQYWQETSINLNHTDTSQSRNCSVAESWESYQKECNPFYSKKFNRTLTETQIVRETLWMLSGVQHTFLYRDIHHDTIGIRDNIQVLHLTPGSLTSLLSAFLVAGRQSLSLQKFVSSVLNPQNDSTQTVQAFATALSCYFKDYKALLSSIEKDIVKQEVSFSLLLLQNKLKRKIDEINTLFCVYQAVFLETGELNIAQKTCRLLTSLYTSIVQTDALGSTAKWKVCLLLRVFLQTVEPYLSFIDEWVMSGRVCDPHNEFFIERIHDITVDSSSFWSDGVILRSSNHLQKPVVPCFLQSVVNQIFSAGKSVKLTEGLGKMSKLYSNRSKGSLYQEFLDELLTSLSTNLSSQESAICVDNTDKGSILDDVANSGQVLSVIKDAGDHVLKLAFMDSSPQNQSLLSYKSSTGEKLERICSGVFNLLKPVELLLNECLTPLIEECCTQASSSIVHLMKTEFCLLDHLAAMRNFFLLEAGDAMHQFYIEIFNKARRHDTWQDISFLNSLMQEALQPRFPQAIERLVVSLSASNSTSRKQVGQSLQGLALNYRAPWPVNIIIDGSCQKLYNLVFLFLLKLKQAKWSLDELRFSDLQGDKQLKGKSDSSDEEETENKPQTTDLATGTPDQELLHRMFLFRFKLMQFINSIHNHFMTRVSLLKISATISICSYLIMFLHMVTQFIDSVHNHFMTRVRLLTINATIIICSYLRFFSQQHSLLTALIITLFTRVQCVHVEVCLQSMPPLASVVTSSVSPLSYTSELASNQI